jgi:hypothetical protein
MPSTKAASKLPAFQVDKAGLAKILERKGKPFAIVELIQNAWDEDTVQVDVTLELVGGSNSPDKDGACKYKLVVEDDNPEGFKDLSHAYTLFAESAKKGDAKKRGRFNLGEKLVIAVCESASIATTKGTIIFEGDSRTHSTKKRDAGSVFTGILRLTPDEAMEIQRVVHTLLPPHGITTTFNMSDVTVREPLRTFTVALRTELADSDGRLKPTTRKCEVEIFEPQDGEAASIYELGIPVVETGDRWHVNVQQKVPLPTDRDNVSPAYLRDVRVAVLNACFDLLSDADTKAGWVSNAMEDENASPEAVKAAFTGKFGEKTVIFDPNDPEANKRAMEQGYNVIPGGALPKAAWSNVKGGSIALPAGQVTPSPNPDEDDAKLKLMDPDHYPEYVRNVVEFSKALALRLLGCEIEVRVANATTWPFDATYGPRKGGTTGRLTLNLGRLGHKWFDTEDGIEAKHVDLLIHEFGHHFCLDHLDSKYLHALSKLGGKATMLALHEPEFFAPFWVPEGVTA